MTDSADDKGHMAENIMHFGRVLRVAGLPIGPGMVIEAIKAVEAVGIRRRDDFYWALNSVFVNRRDQVELFDQAFHIFWRDPRLLEKMIGMVLPHMEADPDKDDSPVSRRLSEAMSPGMGNDREQQSKEEIEVDARLTFSKQERLQKTDFETMSNAELAQAKALIKEMRLPLMQVPTRRLRPSAQGRRVDMRATLRTSLRSGGDIIPLKHRAPVKRHPPLVILCDISGSMSRYSRLFLHFVHAITNDRDRVHTFLFGTRLTNITRHLKHRDVDVSMERIGSAVSDWSGGTRIGTTIAQFNRRWSRRVLGQGALVLFISDGLDRDAGQGLGAEIERLHKSCRRLIWLNPLLRWDGFEAKSIGIRTILPHVDEFRPVHSLDSLADLAEILSRPPLRREDKYMRTTGAAS